ncbi:hypothetical protein [Desulfobotulus mexicanus]|nr:hypothetical protein [Desulfobotulus mexicanus]
MASLVMVKNQDGKWLPSGGCDDLAEDFDFWRIYHNAFPPEEKEPDGIIMKTAKDPLGLVLVFRIPSEEENGLRTAALCTLQFLPRISAAFLIYLAVNPDIRGQGLGSGVLAAAMAQETFAAAGMPMPEHRILEVEDPDRAENDRDRTVRERRLGFFAKAGLFPVYDGYIQPALQQETHVLPMLLLAQSGGLLDMEEAVAAVYMEKYARVNGVEAEVLNSLYRKSFGKNMP